MIGCGTTTFTDPDDYRANVPGTNIDLVLTGSDRFRARVTWVNMHRLKLVRVEETVSRVAFVSPAPALTFVSFPLSRDHCPVWNGVALRRGEIVVHGRGEPFHQHATGATRWGMASLTPGGLAAFSRALLGSELTSPPGLQILRPRTADIADFLRLHSQACRLAEAKPDMAAHPEVARALEQGLAHALVNCLTVNERRCHARTRRHHAEIMIRFEQVLASRGDRPLPVPELCAAVGVAERTLRACCAQFLSMSPQGYVRLRRLNLARSALMRTEPTAANVRTIARQYGFSELGRFAAAYRAVFGETPSATLRGASFASMVAAEIA
jgi:AraC-like DNA-binding protein